MDTLIADLHDRYLKSLEDKAAAMNEFAHDRNFKEATRIGHQMKGSGASYGFPAVSDLGRRIEEAGTNHQGMTLDALVIELKTLLARLRDQQAV